MQPAWITHPDAETLARFRCGALNPENVEDIASHVSDCAECCRSLQQLPDDSLIELVRQSVAVGSVPADLIEHPRYEVLERLGSGGMGTVYKARHRLMDRLVALKVIEPRLLDRPGVVERFRREVRAAAGLLHPNIVTAHDADEAGSTHFLVMEYVQGVTLAQHVAANGPLPAAEACHCIRQAALALQHAHNKGMVHRDIKPHNLMRTADGQIKVLDFGLARFASEVRSADVEPAADDKGGSTVTSAGMMLGTADYMAPEQLRDPHSADIRADIFSLGRTLFYLLIGHLPSPEDTAMQQFSTSHPPVLNRVIGRMLDADPARRYQTPAEVASALEAFAEKEQPRPRWKRLCRAALMLALPLLIVCAAAAVYRIATDKGEIVVETDDPSIEVIIRQGGKEVTIIDPKTERKIQLRSGKYEIALSGAGGELRLATGTFTLHRGEKKIVSVKHIPQRESSTVQWNTRTKGSVKDYFVPATQWAQPQWGTTTKGSVKGYFRIEPFNPEKVEIPAPKK